MIFAPLALREDMESQLGNGKWGLGNGHRKQWLLL